MSRGDELFQHKCWHGNWDHDCDCQIGKSHWDTEVDYDYE